MSGNYRGVEQTTLAQKEDAEAYAWELTSSWLSLAGTVMFSNVPAGTYKLIMLFTWEGSGVHSNFTITGEGFSHKLGFGSSDGAGAPVSNYEERTVYIKTTSAGAIIAKAAFNNGTGGVLRPSATMIRIYKGDQ